MKSFGQHLLS